MGDGDHLGARGDQLHEFIEQELAIVGHRRPFQHRALPLAQEMPGHDVGVVLHDGEEDLVPLPDMRDAIGRGDEIDRLGGVAGEDDLGVGPRIEEAAHALARLLEIGGREVAQIMQPAMHIGVVLAIGALDGVEHELRLLRRGAVVEIDEVLAVDLAREDREVGADRLDVEGRSNRSEILGRRCEHGHRPLLHSTLTPSQSAEACASASRSASSSTRSSASPTKAWISSARACASGMPRASR